MTKSYKELLAEREILNHRIVEAWKAERREAIVAIRDLMTRFGINERSLSLKLPRYVPKKSGRYVPKYVNPESGQTWSGKGKPPAWIVGKDRATFAVSTGSIENGLEPEIKDKRMDVQVRFKEGLPHATPQTNDDNAIESHR